MCPFPTPSGKPNMHVLGKKANKYPRRVFWHKGHRMSRDKLAKNLLEGKNCDTCWGYLYDSECPHSGWIRPKVYTCNKWHEGVLYRKVNNPISSAIDSVVRQIVGI
jgi:hypothetical protein